MILDFNRRIHRGLMRVPFQLEELMIDFEQARLLYLNRINSVRISAQEKNKVRVKLETVEQHLLLLKP